MIVIMRYTRIVYYYYNGYITIYKCQIIYLNVFRILGRSGKLGEQVEFLSKLFPKNYFYVFRVGFHKELRL